ncbi:MAG TPA: fibronectin type III domain-containing protein, partial [Opitutaceae bacterium]
GPAAQATPGSGIPAAYAALAEGRIGAPMPPRPPTAVSAEPEDESAYVTWLPSGFDGGSAVTGYTVACSSGAKATVSAADFQATGHVVFDDLENGRAVSFTVSAINGTGAGAASLPSAGVTPLRKRHLRPPAAPAGATLSRLTQGSRVFITPPATDGGSPIIAYSLVSSPDGTRIEIAGLDVIHADPAHLVDRTFADFTPPPGAVVSIAARTVAGEGPSAILKLP